MAGRRRTIADLAALQHFLDTRASLVAQDDALRLPPHPGRHPVSGAVRERRVRRLDQPCQVADVALPVFRTSRCSRAGCSPGIRKPAPRLPARPCGARWEAILERTGTPDDSGPPVRRRREGGARSTEPVRPGTPSTTTRASSARVRKRSCVTRPSSRSSWRSTRRSSVTRCRFRWQEVRRELRANLDANMELEQSD